MKNPLNKAIINIITLFTVNKPLFSLKVSLTDEFVPLFVSLTFSAVELSFTSEMPDEESEDKSELLEPPEAFEVELYPEPPLDELDPPEEPDDESPEELEWEDSPEEL